MATPQVLKYFKTFTTDQLGQIQLTDIVDIKDFSKVNFAIVTDPLQDPTRILTALVYMGQLSGVTVGEPVDEFVIDPYRGGSIHTYDVVGPELAIWVMGAPANTNVNVQAWVFLH